LFVPRFQVPTLSGDVNSFIGSLHRLHEEIEYDESQNFDEEDSKSGVDALITVNDTDAADAFSMAYIQVGVSSIL
jgi:hypothetical protein